MSSERTRRRLLIAALLFILQLLLGLWVAASPTLSDRLFSSFLQDWTGPTAGLLLRRVSWIGNGASPFLMVAIVAAILVYPVAWRKEACLLLLGAALVGILDPLGKFFLGRSRPTAEEVQLLASSGSPAYPSGHAAFAFFFFGLLALMVLRHSKRNWLRWLLVSFLALLVLAMGLSRVYLGLHWLTDVLGGYLLGAAVLVGLAGYYPVD